MELCRDGYSLELSQFKVISRTSDADRPVDHCEPLERVANHRIGVACRAFSEQSSGVADAIQLNRCADRPRASASERNEVTVIVSTRNHVSDCLCYVGNQSGYPGLRKRAFAAIHSIQTQCFDTFHKVRCARTRSAWIRCRMLE